MPIRRENCVTALTFEEARERSRLLDVRGYRVDLDVTGGGEAFGSVTVVRFGYLALHGGLDNAQRVFADFSYCKVRLATGALTGSLRRLLADQLEDLRRSVAVRSLEDPSSYRG